MAPKAKPGPTERKKWDPDKMKATVTDVREKQMGYLKASKKFAVPRSSFFRLANNKLEDVSQAVLTKLGRKPVFSRELDDELVKYLEEMENMYYGLKKKLCLFSSLSACSSQ
ncbi:hypothetical protein WA026_012340 [Henosepilachna vigintioctopunctata]|uniref:HTH psq-type domain-containing protein n=1 Tax=Henosepilachna vigintioctopunctata TaxID=420089 RepID=A0AAW1UQ03_9CUCU